MAVSCHLLAVHDLALHDGRAQQRRQRHTDAKADGRQQEHLRASRVDVKARANLAVRAVIRALTVQVVRHEQVDNAGDQANEKQNRPQDAEVVSHSRDHL